jgi:hypothetical protein
VPYSLPPPLILSCSRATYTLVIDVDEFTWPEYGLASGGVTEEKEAEEEEEAAAEKGAEEGEGEKGEKAAAAGGGGATGGGAILGGGGLLKMLQRMTVLDRGWGVVGTPYNWWVVYGVRCVVCRVSCVMCGVRCAVCCVWCTVCGVWCMVRGVWRVVYGVYGVLCMGPTYQHSAHSNSHALQVGREQYTSSSRGWYWCIHSE